MFLFKLALAPVLEALPPLQQWRARDASLKLSYKHESSEPPANAQHDAYDLTRGTLEVIGFGKRKLACAKFVPAAVDKNSWLQRLGNFLRIGE